MKKRFLNLEEYGISRKRYKELAGFCEQYPEWKRELAMKDSAIKSSQLTGMPVARKITDTTGDLAVRRAILQEKCRLIEDVAREASEELYEYIIKSVCYEVTVAHLISYYEMPCGQAAFCDVRRYFFYLLSQRKQY
ncbi:MAG: hypothetical protein IJF60_06305 [Agathobacter sp.]|nr:hypothetical protein [Agathobacter sp.]